MATKHTANYQLNLWEPNDAFVRTEFNENSNKIDAAIMTRKGHILLSDRTTTAVQNSVIADLSGISPSACHQIDVRFSVPNCPQSTYLRVNELSGAVYRTVNQGVEINEGVNAAGVTAAGWSGARTDFYCSLLTYMAEWNVTLKAEVLALPSDRRSHREVICQMSSLSWSGLRCVNICGYDSSITVPAGTRVQVWGGDLKRIEKGSVPNRGTEPFLRVCSPINCGTIV